MKAATETIKAINHGFVPATGLTAALPFLASLLTMDCLVA
jgi:hypothetical protein